MFARVKERISWSAHTMTLIKHIILTTLLAHSFACTFAISTTFADSPLDTWLGTFGYCKPAGFDENGERLAVCADAAYRYLHCLWGGIALLTAYNTGPYDGPYEPHYSRERLNGLDGSSEWAMQCKKQSATSRICT